jgi:hypothetical protein
VRGADILSNDAISPAGTNEAARRPAWRSALAVFAVLFTLSEGLYLILGSIAKTCLAPGAACGSLATGVSSAIFVNATNESGAPMLSNLISIGLPGFSNLFYLFLAGITIDDYGQLLATVAASVIIGFVVLWGYVAMIAKRGVAMRLVLAVAFAIGWWVLYNNTEASIYKVDFSSIAPSRYLEIPIAAISMFIASFFARRQGA